MHPRDDARNPLRGVFGTRSADRPNPIGLHEVEVVAVEGERVQVRPLEAVDGTPILDLKPVIQGYWARMSDETVELVRRAYDTFNRRDWEAFRRMMDREVTVESRLVQMDGGYRGYDGLRRWWDEVFETMPDYRVEIENLREVGDIVLVQARGLGHGATSGTPVVDPFWHAIEMKQGRCTWWRNCSTEAEALEAIAERSGSAADPR